MKKIVLILTAFGSLSANPVKFLSPNVLNVSTGYTISSTGYYVITDNVIFTNLANSTNAITITSSNVTLDLNDKVLQAPTGGTSQGCIFLNRGITNVTIKNGTVQFWPSTTAGAIGWSGSASSSVRDVVFDNLKLLSCQAPFNSGSAFGARLFFRNLIVSDATTNFVVNVPSDCFIENCKFLNFRTSSAQFAFDFSGVSGAGARISNCTVDGNTAGGGIRLSNCSGVIVENCVASNNGTIGINVGGNCSGVVVSNCTALRNTQSGIHLGETVSGSITGSVLITNCIAEGNGNTGIGLRQTATLCVVQNCLALCNGTTGIANLNTSNLVMGCLSTRNTLTDYQGTGGVSSINPISLVNPINIAAGTMIDPRNNIAVVNLAGT